tara:strand:+ start:122 stop:277 length:156 start_codon:yes stop_codon:yes gene_type:complete
MNTLTGNTFYRVSSANGFTFDYATLTEALKLQAELNSVTIATHVATMYIEA